MRTSLLVVLMGFSATALSAPFVVSDPVDPAATHCGVFMDSQPKATVTVTPDTGGNICKFDLAGIASGSHTVQMTAIINDPLWGVQESPKSSPLTFARPGVPATPAGPRLTP